MFGMNETAATKRAVRLPCMPRVLLLVLLAFGVGGMHTFGHGGDVDHHTSGGHGVAGQVPSRIVPADAGPDAVRHQPVVAGTGEPATGGGMDLGGFTVCLAVLGALGLTFLVTMLRARSRGGDLPAALLLATARAPGRGPPVRRLGLRVATVSVLRI